MAAAESLDDIVLGAITMEEDDIQTLNLRQCGQNLEVANLTDPIVFWLNVSNNNNSNFTYTEVPSFVCCISCWTHAARTSRAKPGRTKHPAANSQRIVNHHAHFTK